MLSLAYILLFLLLFTIQTTLLEFIEIGGVRPDLIMIAVVFMGFRLPTGKSIAMGGLIGLVQDTLSGGIIGMNLLSKGLAGLLSAHLKESVVMENIPSQSFLIIGATILEGLAFQLLSNIFPTMQLPEGFWKDMTVLAAYNGLLGPIGFLMLRKTFRNMVRQSVADKGIF